MRRGVQCHRQCLLDVGEQIVCVLDAGAQADEALGHRV